MCVCVCVCWGGDIGVQGGGGGDFTAVGELVTESIASLLWVGC